MATRKSRPVKRVTSTVEKGRTPAKIKVGLSEIGHSGLSETGGLIREDFLRDLQGRSGQKVFKEMSLNDSVIGAIMFAATMLIRQASWTVKPVSEDKADTDLSEFVNSCRDDMSMTWPDVMAEVLSMLTYGWSVLEQVYKKRGGYIRNSGDTSKFSDGRIGWKKLPLRSQDSLDRWIFDEKGGLRGMTQRTVTGKMAVIPIEKMLLFRTTSAKNNPEGISAIRNAYRAWYFKKRIEEIEGIGIERDLAGLPVLTTPEDVDIWNPNDQDAIATKAVAEKIVQSIRRDEQEGVLLPFGWKLELMASAGKKSIDTNTVIARYNTVIAMTVLADFIILGHNNRYGSFALASSKTHMFSVAIGGWLDAVADVFNRYAIPRLLEINGISVERPPTLVHGDVEVPDLAELGNYISKLTGSGFPIFPNKAIERYLLKTGGMPWTDEEGVTVGRGDEVRGNTATTATTMEQADKAAEAKTEVNDEKKKSGVVTGDDE